MDWQPAERVQKNESGEYRALIGGEWIPVTKAQKNSEGQYRVMRQEMPEESQAPEQPRNYGDMVEQGLRQTALMGRAATSGLAGLPVLGAEAVAYPINKFSEIVNKYFGTSIPRSEPGQLFQQAQTSVFGVEPETRQERLTGDVISAVGGAAGMAKGGEVLAKAAKSPTVQNIGKTLAANQLLQVPGAATSGLGAGYAREEGAGPIGQTLAGLGAAFVPALASTAVSGIKTATKPLVSAAKITTEAGKLEEAKRIINKLAGDNKTQIVNAAKDAQEFVPGSPVTSAEAIAQGNLATQAPGQQAQRFGGEVVKLQSELAKSQGTTAGLRSIGLKQQAAHNQALDKIAGTEAQYKTAVKVRETATKPFWDKVETSTAKVKPGNVYMKIDEIINKNVNEPAITGPLNEIKSKLIVGETPKGFVLESNPQNLVSLSRRIKDMMATKRPDGTNEYNVSKLTEIKTILDDQIGKAEPAYKQAMQSYKALSSPINRMEVGRELKDKLLNVSGTESPGQYLKSVDDAAKTIKSATGFARYKSLDDVLTAEEVKSVKNVAKDLERSLEARRMASEVTLPGATTMAEGAEFKLPNLLSRPAMAANWVLSHIGHDANPEVNKMMAEILSDPKKLGAALKDVPPGKVQAVVSDMMRKAKIARTGVVGGMAGVMANEE